MFVVAAILVAIAGIGLVLFGLGYSAVFFAAQKVFDRALGSEIADQGKAYVESAIGRIKSEFVRRQLRGRIGTSVGAAAVSLVRGQLGSGVTRGFVIAGAGFVCLVASLSLPWLLAMVWPK